MVMFKNAALTFYNKVKTALWAQQEPSLGP